MSKHNILSIYQIALKPLTTLAFTVISQVWFEVLFYTISTIINLFNFLNIKLSFKKEITINDLALEKSQTERHHSCHFCCHGYHCCLDAVAVATSAVEGCILASPLRRGPSVKKVTDINLIAQISMDIQNTTIHHFRKCTLTETLETSNQ